MHELELRAHLAAIVDSSDDAIISKDLNGVVQSFNRAAVAMFGYTPAEIIGKPITLLLPAERLHEETAILAKLRRGEKVDHFETVRRTKSGRLVDVAVTISPIRGADGVIVGASKIVRDITDRRRAASATALLAAIVESSDDAILSKDLDGTILTFNAAAERMFGYSAAEIVGRSILTLIPEDRHAEERTILGRIRSGERIEHFETLRRAKSGDLLHLSITVSPIRDETGVIVGASKVARNIGEQKRVALLLAQQQEWFRVTLNSIGEAVIACDREGRVTFLNRVAADLTAWSPESARHALLNDVFDARRPNSARVNADLVASVLASGRPLALPSDTLIVSRLGRSWPVAASAAPISTGDGGALGVVVVFREISEQKATEARMLLVNGERERLLQNERASRNEAERANRVKDDFVAMVSHELRTPLNAILGWSQLLTQPNPDPSILPHGLEVIARNTRLQAQLIADLLDVSRMMSGKLHLNLERVDLADVVRNSIEALKSSAEAKGIVLDVECDAPSVSLIADPARLQQIVLNVGSNAIKFTPLGGKVSVRCRGSEKHAEVVVTDTGIGIGSEALPDIFERFRQASTPSTRRHGGLGLGLSISRHLALLHGGSLSASSAGPNLGSTFVLQIPRELELRGAGQESEPAPSVASPAEDELTSSLRSLHVFVVDDDQDTRDLLLRLLEAQGAIVAVAASAPEALDLLPVSRAAILVSDIGLPDVDGYELIRRLREREDEWSRIPAIALSAFARQEDKARALRAGFNAHVSKPIEPRELIAVIASFRSLVRER